MGLTWEAEVRGGVMFTIQRSTDGVNFSTWTTGGFVRPETRNSNLSPGTTYYYRIMASTQGGASGWSNVARGTTPPDSGPPPDGWLRADVGGASPGTDSPTGANAMSVTGTGADIWDTRDEFHYVYQNWSGDGVFIARVGSLSATESWAKAGVMVRESTAAGARHALVCVSMYQGCGLFARTSTDGATSFVPASGSAPRWLRLVRF